MVEMVMVVVIMAILFTMGTANYRDYQQRQYLESAALQVEADLRLAQQMALSGVKPEEPAGNDCQSNNLSGYLFWRSRGYDSGPPEETAQYTIYALCPDWDDRVLVKGPVDLPRGIELRPFGGGNKFYFEVLARGIDRESDVNINLRYIDSGLPDATVVVRYRGGTIERL
jgi:type II secretory pathway pseudopilin PulG